MAKPRGLRATATLYQVASFTAAFCLALDVALLIARHPTGWRRLRDIAYLPVYAVGAYVFLSGYRRFRAQVASSTLESED